MEVSSQEVLRRIVTTTHFYEDRQLECQQNLKSQNELQDYKDDKARRKLILKLKSPLDSSHISDEYMKIAVESAFGPVELVYGIKHNNTQLGYFFLTMKSQHHAKEILGKQVISLKIRNPSADHLYLKDLTFSALGWGQKPQVMQKIH